MYYSLISHGYLLFRYRKCITSPVATSPNIPGLPLLYNGWLYSGTAISNGCRVAVTQNLSDNRWLKVAIVRVRHCCRFAWCEEIPRPLYLSTTNSWWLHSVLNTKLNPFRTCNLFRPLFPRALNIIKAVLGRVSMVAFFLFYLRSDKDILVSHWR